jgi:hypothetical protein
LRLYPAKKFGRNVHLPFFYQGIHAIVKNNASGKMFHRVFNISTGNVEIDSKFPTETSAFLGLVTNFINLNFFLKILSCKD